MELVPVDREGDTRKAVMLGVGTVTATVGVGIVGVETVGLGAVTVALVVGVVVVDEVAVELALLEVAPVVDTV